MREEAEALSKMPASGTGAQNRRTHESMIVTAPCLKSSAFNYIGPLTGHDLDVGCPTLGSYKPSTPGRRFLPYRRKRQGYAACREDSPGLTMAVPAFDPSLDSLPKSATVTAITTTLKCLAAGYCDMANGRTSARITLGHARRPGLVQVFRNSIPALF